MGARAEAHDGVNRTLEFHGNMDGSDVRPVSPVVWVVKMNELHMERARQVGQLPGQDYATPGVTGFGDLEFVFGRETGHDCQVLVGCSVELAKLVASQILPLMRKMLGHAVEMFAHGVVRRARPQHQDYSRLLIGVNRQVRHLAIYEMIDFSNRNIVWRSHESTYGFLNLQSL